MSGNNCCVRFHCISQNSPSNTVIQLELFQAVQLTPENVVEEKPTYNRIYVYELSPYVGFSVINAVLSAQSGCELYSRMSKSVHIAPLDEISKPELCSQPLFSLMKRNWKLILIMCSIQNQSYRCTLGFFPTLHITISGAYTYKHNVIWFIDLSEIQRVIMVNAISRLIKPCRETVLWFEFFYANAMP